MLDQFPHLFISKGSFAEMTFKVRYLKILQDIIDAEIFKASINHKLLQLKNNLGHTTVLHLHESNDPYWLEFYTRYLGQRIIELPFFFAEVYFFALIRELVKYSTLQTDPFKRIKETELKKSSKFINDTILESNHWQTNEFIRFALEGNKSDLSQLKNGFDLNLNLLINDSKDLIDSISTANAVHIIQDNSGVELFSDLLLANHIVSNYDCKTIIHIKYAPIFVSDSLEIDIQHLLSSIEESTNKQQLLNNIQKKEIEIKASPFWTSPNHFTNWKSELELQHDDLIISKGDANYRRFFEDRQFDPSTSSKSLTSYLSHPTFCIRTLKSEIQTGISQSDLIKLKHTHGNWMTNGQFAVIQHLNPE